MNVYQAIASLDNSQKNIAATLLSGSCAGEMAVFSGCSLYWSDTDSENDKTTAFLPLHAGSICAVDRSGIVTIDGQPVFCEILGSVKKLVVCGAGHVSLPIIRLGKMTEMHVTCIDDRPDFAEKARQAGADAVICSRFREALSGIPSDMDTSFVIVTRGHRWDKECLLEIFRKPYAYVGMMGSRSRISLLKESLLEEGISSSQLDTLHAPIGLSIGAETPAELAISIFAEIISTARSTGSSSSFPRKLMTALLAEDRQRRVLATIIGKHGSAPRSIGTKMLIREDGTCTATIGGGCAEMYITAQAQHMMKDDTSPRLRIIEVDMTTETASDEGMVCGGRIQVLLQLV